MKKAKFKVGETIHFMKNDKPEQKEILGIVKFEGLCEGLHDKVNAQESVIKYYVGDYDVIEESKVFETKKKLQEHLFGVEAHEPAYEKDQTKTNKKHTQNEKRPCYTKT